MIIVAWIIFILLGLTNIMFLIALLTRLKAGKGIQPGTLSILIGLWGTFIYFLLNGNINKLHIAWLIPVVVIVVTFIIAPIIGIIQLYSSKH